MRIFRGVVIVLVTALAAAGCTSAAVRPTTRTSPPPTPAVDQSATPAGWVPVAYGDAQISVPATWVIIVNGDGSCSAHPPGYVVFGTGKFIPDCRPPANASSLPSAFLGPLVGGITPGPSVEIHGIRAIVVRETCAGCLVYQFPSLGVVVSTSGAFKRQVMDTLRASPRAVAVTPSPAPAVPSSWRRLSFAGISFAVPSTWPVQRPIPTTRRADRRRRWRSERVRQRRPWTPTDALSSMAACSERSSR